MTNSGQPKIHFVINLADRSQIKTKFFELCYIIMFYDKCQTGIRSSSPLPDEESQMDYKKET